jgi:hypothetical protein
MTHENEKASRDWREIIADSYKESDPEKIRKLAEELDRALDQRDIRSSGRNQCSAVCGFPLAQRRTLLSLA